MVKTSRPAGGLGVHDLKILNEALLAKWAWRFAVERNAWWRGLMIVKCGKGRSDWQTSWNVGSAGCSMWIWIARSCSLFWRHGYLDPGGGMCDFWSDVWIRGVRLGEEFPRIAAAAQYSEAMVCDVCSFVSGWTWDIPLSTTLRGGALNEWELLLERLHSLPADTITAGPASVIWPLEKSGSFSVSSLRRHLSNERFVGIQDFPLEVIWSKVVPTKIQGFCWMVWHGKIASIDNLQKRGMTMVNRCVLCEKDAESVDHIFTSCEFSSLVWDRVSSKLSLFGPRHNNVKGMFSAWKGMNCIQSFPEASKALMHSLVWFIWLERNDRVFNDVRKGERQVAYRVLYNIGSWLAAAKFFSAAKLTCWNSFVLEPD
ncbi:Putative ribonuclease H protein At1g65750 [Linum perenne]